MVLLLLREGSKTDIVPRYFLLVVRIAQKTAPEKNSEEHFLDFIVSILLRSRQSTSTCFLVGPFRVPDHHASHFVHGLIAEPVPLVLVVVPQIHRLFNPIGMDFFCCLPIGLFDGRSVTECQRLILTNWNERAPQTRSMD